MRCVAISLFGILAGASPAFAAPTPYYSYYDPIYDSGVVEDTLMPQGVSLGDSLFGKSGGAIGGFLSSMKLHAAAATAVEATDNAKSSSTDRKSDIADTTTLGLGATSDWDRHALSFGINDSIKRFRNQVSENQDGVHVFVDGRVDITDGWNLIGGLHYARDNENRDSPQEASTTLSRLRTIEDTGGRFGLNYEGAVFSVSTQATYDHITVEKLDGETLGYRDRDVSRYATRISYPVTDALRVYVQPAYSHEVYDVRFDASGINRNNSAIELVGGVAYQVNALTDLDFGIGQITRSPDDARLSDATGLQLNASLLWSPYEGFSLSSALSHTIESTTLSGVNDISTTSFRLIPSLAIAEATVLTGELGIDRFNFSGSSRTDDDYLAGIGLNYLWNDTFNTGVRYRYRHRLSDAIGRDFYSNTILLTLSCSL